MKKKLLLSLLTFSIVFSAVTISSSKKAQPPVAKTGAPSEGTCGSTATGCHNTATNTGTGTLIADFGANTYSWGQVITGTVTTSETGMTRFGFEGTVLDNSTNTKAGEFTITDAVNTTLQTSGGREYIGHKAASSNNTWSFNWNGPNPTTGPLTFYVASICGNANNTAGGDHCYSTTVALEPLMNGVNDVALQNDLLVLDNTLAENFSLKYFSSSDNNTLIRLIDINGKVVTTLVNQKSFGVHLLYFTKPHIAGLYFVDYMNGNNHVVKKLVVM